MLRTLRINPAAKIMTIPTESIEQGYSGDVEVLMNALTMTVIKPGTTLEDARKSLEIVLADLDLRIQQKNRKDITT